MQALKRSSRSKDTGDQMRFSRSVLAASEISRATGAGVLCQKELAGIVAFRGLAARRRASRRRRWVVAGGHGSIC
jgi:hypothetical protein